MYEFLRFKIFTRMTQHVSYLFPLSFNKSAERNMNKETYKRTGFKKEPMVYIQRRSVRTQVGQPAALTQLTYLHIEESVAYIYINKIQRDATVCRCLFTAKLLHMFRVSIAPIIRSRSNCNCSFWYRSQCQSNNLPPVWPRWRKVVASRWILLIYCHDARNHKKKIK